jgi:hypothetical protein
MERRLDAHVGASLTEPAMAPVLWKFASPRAPRRTMAAPAE